jgi:L-amino acid N-acyltransferase YncA
VTSGIRDERPRDSSRALIRTAVPADLEQVTAMYAHYVATSIATFETEPPPVDYWRQRLDDLAERDLPFLVAVAAADGDAVGGEACDAAVDEDGGAAVDAAGAPDGAAACDAAGGVAVNAAGGVAGSPGQSGTVVGYSFASPWRPRPAYRFTVEDSVYVAPGQAGRGIGSALLASLLDRCAEAGVRQMIAVIADTGSDASTALHARFGFRQAGRLANVGRKHGRWIDTVLMQRTLP